MNDCNECINLTANLYEEIRIIKEFAKHRGSGLILYLLFELREAHQEQLMRLVGSQKATEQALEWLLKMHMIELQKSGRFNDARIKGYYHLTTNGQKVARAFVDSLKTVIAVYEGQTLHRVKK